MPDVENALPRHLGLHGDGGGVGVELEVFGCVGIGCEEKLAPGIDGEAGEIPVEILAAGEAVDLHCETVLGAGGKDGFPASAQTRPIVEVPCPRMGENVDPGGGDSAEKALGLVAVGVEEPMDRGDDTVEVEPFTSRNIEGSVLEDLDLETLKDAMFVTVLLVPQLDAFSLEFETLRVEAGGDLESA